MYFFFILHIYEFMFVPLDEVIGGMLFWVCLFSYNHIFWSIYMLCIIYSFGL